MFKWLDWSVLNGALACGSMVLYRYCMLFFRPAGRKNNIQGIEHDHCRRDGGVNRHCGMKGAKYT
jgi:hypothetical protein